jgi:hypothetical protein
MKTDITRLASRAWWIGFATGAVLAFALGFVVGLGSADKTVVIPLERGIET